MDKFDTLYSVFKELEQILQTLEGKEEKRQVNNALCDVNWAYKCARTQQ